MTGYINFYNLETNYPVINDIIDVQSSLQLYHNYREDLVQRLNSTADRREKKEYHQKIRIITEYMEFIQEARDNALELN